MTQPFFGGDYEHAGPRPRVTFRGGRAAPHSAIVAPRLRLAPFLTRLSYPAPPGALDYVAGIPDWPMYGNDNWGDCVWAMIGHIIEAMTFYGQGAVVKVSDADVLKGYSDVTGFDPNAGPPGDNPTDQGTVIQDALNYWRKTGVGGHKIAAFFKCDPSNPTEIEGALYLFGHLCLGINFPQSAMDQFNRGEVWDVVKGSPIEGGHAINNGGYRSATAMRRLIVLGKALNGNWLIVTWGRVQEMTPAFWDKYVEEVWTVADAEWVHPDGTVPAGLDVAAANATFTSLTGEPGPFVVPGPAPTPTPTPAPPESVWQEIIDLLRKIVNWIEGKESS